MMVGGNENTLYQLFREELKMDYTTCVCQQAT